MCGIEIIIKMRLTPWQKYVYDFYFLVRLVVCKKYLQFTLLSGQIHLPNAGLIRPEVGLMHLPMPNQTFICQKGH